MEQKPWDINNMIFSWPLIVSAYITVVSQYFMTGIYLHLPYSIWKHLRLLHQPGHLGECLEEVCRVGQKSHYRLSQNTYSLLPTLAKLWVSYAPLLNQSSQQVVASTNKDLFFLRILYKGRQGGSTEATAGVTHVTRVNPQLDRGWRGSHTAGIWCSMFPWVAHPPAERTELPHSTKPQGTKNKARLPSQVQTEGQPRFSDRKPLHGRSSNGTLKAGSQDNLLHQMYSQ